MFIPLVFFLWHFVVVVKLSQSLRNEFVRRGQTNVDPNPGLKVGLAMCCMQIIGLIPIGPIWWLSVVLGTGLWIAYWIVISKYSKSLAVPVAATI